MIPYAKQDVNLADIDAVVQILTSDFLTQGPVVPQFEEAIAKRCKAHYGIAVNSATSALHLLCMAMDLGPGDWLWTSPITFVASANCALYCGAKVDFVDIDPVTNTMCPLALEAKLIKAQRDGVLPKIVIPVHFSGQSCAMQAIHRLAQCYGFKIIEDASHAIGGQYQGQPIGSCDYSDATVFSFHPVKIITTGEGGLIVTNDSEIDKRVRLLRSHGITRDELLMTEPSHGPWYYQQIALGFNYRMTELQAALGLSQLDRLDQFLQRRHQLAANYNHQLGNLPLVIPYQAPDNYSALHLYVIRLDLKRLQMSRVEVVDFLRMNGVGVNVHYIPVHMQPYYKNLGFKVGQFPVAEQYYQEVISLPMYPAMTDHEQEEVIAAIKKCLAN